MSDILSAVWEGNIGLVRLLVEEEGEDDPKSLMTVGGLTLLHWSCLKGHLHVTRYFIEELRFYPGSLDFSWMTPLHSASGSVKTSMHGKLERTVKYLIESCGCSPDNTDKLGRTPFYLACQTGQLGVVQYLFETCHCEPKTADRKGRTPLHHACGRGHMKIVHYLVETCLCDPKHSQDMDGCTPLHWACGYHGNYTVVKYLTDTCQCDPNCAGNDGSTPLHWASRGGELLSIIHLVDTALCNTSCVDKNGRTPLHLATEKGRFEVVQYLVEGLHCDPEQADNDGLTPLHLASKNRHMEIVKYLLLECHCNPNCKTKDGKTPIDLVVNCHQVVGELVKARATAAIKSLQPPVKIFIVGNLNAGKSSLMQSLLTETSALKAAAISCIAGPRLLRGVEQTTTGIVPCQFESKKYGNVAFYVFAGQQDYYASHAALLQSSLSSSAPLFIIVVDLCDSSEDIKQTVTYWLSFLANQCSSISTKPHVIIVGSHSDVVRSKGENPKTKVAMNFLQNLQVSKEFHVISKLFPVTCNHSSSHGTTKLADSLKRSCEALKKNLPCVPYHVSCLHAFLVDEFQGYSGVTFGEVMSSSSPEMPLGAKNPYYLHCSCSILQQAGRIIYIKNPDIKKSWIILEKSLLSEVNGVLFAPKGFRQYRNLASSSGVVPVSNLAQCFPQHNQDMLIQFLSHLEFCYEIRDQEALQVINQGHLPPGECHSGERYLFFPSLVSAVVPNDVWMSGPHFSQLSGWMLQCCDARQGLTSQFLHVLLLRLAFSCAIALDSISCVQLPVLERKCRIWKNGIYWVSHVGIEALVEVRDPPQNKEVLVALRCLTSDQEVECARLRSTIVKMVLGAKEKLCSKVLTKEFFIHPTQIKEHPFKSFTKHDLFSITEVSRAVVGDNELGTVSSDDRTVNLKEMNLDNEPYAELGAEILRELFSSSNTKLAISDNFLNSIACHTHEKEHLFTKILRPSSPVQPKHETVESSVGSCLSVLQSWRGDSGTYQSLRETLDQFSVFAGRNPLVSLIMMQEYCSFMLCFHIFTETHLIFQPSGVRIYFCGVYLCSYSAGRPRRR